MLQFLTFLVVMGAWIGWMALYQKGQWIRAKSEFQVQQGIGQWMQAVDLAKNEHMSASKESFKQAEEIWKKLEAETKKWTLESSLSSSGSSSVKQVGILLQVATLMSQVGQALIDLKESTDTLVNTFAQSENPADQVKDWFVQLESIAQKVEQGNQMMKQVSPNILPDAYLSSYIRFYFKTIMSVAPRADSLAATHWCK
ncbi:hypothetical protein IPJ72_04985 [Candidatus Peregrinibacteria bacterium]|nr:MAG: hypothetical protein IPJ72_04985 [Candidatus Peregrinibacteria bacterium]